jgi:hypothetical protein
MSHSPANERAGRRLVPCGLKELFKGAAPGPLLLDLNLPAGTPFEAIEAVRVDYGSRDEDRRLVVQLAAAACPAEHHHRLAQSTPAFPQGVAGTIDLGRLPLHARTRNCLKKRGLISPGALERLTLRDLLAIAGFGAFCLVDLLTAVEGANTATLGKTVTLGLGTDVGVLEVASILPRLTHEAELLGREPWAEQVRLFDARLGRTLLLDHEPPKKVHEALRTGRVAMEQPLCPEAPVFDIDARLLPLERHVVDSLVKTGLKTLRAIACLTPSELLARLGDLDWRSWAQVFGMLDACRFMTPQATAVDRVPCLAEFCRAVINRTSDSWFSERLANRIVRTRALANHYSSLSLGEELRSLGRAVGWPRPAVARAFLGWDGKGRCSAEQVRQRRRVTAQNVWSIAAQFRRRLGAVSAWVPTVRRALDFCAEICPLPAEEVARLLHERGFTRAPFHPYGLLTAAKLVRLAHPFSLQRFADVDWLVQGEDAVRVGSGVMAVRGFVRGHGVGSVAGAREVSSETVLGSMSEDALRQWVLEPLGVRWLDSERTWFHYPSRRAVVESKLWKILAVAPEIRLGDLESGLLRHRRAIAVPTGPILLELCGNLGLEVKDEVIRTPQPVRREKVLNAVELTVYDVLQSEGPLMRGAELERRCLERGAHRNTYINCIMYSPIVARYGVAIYGLRGARVLPAEVEAFRGRVGRMRRGKGITNCGLRSNGVPWITYKLGPSMVSAGVVPIPASVRLAVGEGRWPLFTVDGTQVGELVSRRAFAWGWVRYFRRTGAVVGDIMVLEIDGGTGTAKIAVGGPELLEQSECPMSQLTASLVASVPSDTV